MDSRKESISKGYDEIAESIMLDDAFYARAINLNDNYSGKVLDIGCGQGMLLKKLHEKSPGAELFGIDLSNKLAELAKKNNPEANIRVGDAEELPFDNNTFDFVFMTETLEHLLDHNKAISEAKRVLKPGGIFVVTVPNRDWLRFEFYDKMRDHSRQPVDDHYFTFKEVSSLLKNNGFKILKYRGSDNLYYYIPYHKYEQALARIFPFLHRKMKRLLFKCQKPE